MAAVAGLAADPELAQPFVQRLWDAPIPTGKWRYYDGLLSLLALLEVSGNFRIYVPASALHAVATPARTAAANPRPLDAVRKDMPVAAVWSPVGGPKGQVGRRAWSGSFFNFNGSVISDGSRSFQYAAGDA